MLNSSTREKVSRIHFYLKTCKCLSLDIKKARLFRAGLLSLCNKEYMKKIDYLNAFNRLDIVAPAPELLKISETIDGRLSMGKGSIADRAPPVGRD